MKYNYTRLVLTLLIVSATLSAEIDVSLGHAVNLPGDIEIKNNDGSRINFQAKYKTKGLKSPQYYSIRIRKEILKVNAEFELVHHKLYVDDGLPPEISKFEITDGFNLLTLNTLVDISSNFSCRAGSGIVVAHPDVTINGETNFIRGGGFIPKFWSDGYHWGGFTAQVSLVYIKKIRNFRYNIESKFVYANSNVPVIDGSMDISNISLHFLAGLSFGK